jgi:hypothetical protein
MKVDNVDSYNTGLFCTMAEVAEILGVDTTDARALFRLVGVEPTFAYKKDLKARGRGTYLYPRASVEDVASWFARRPKAG